MGLDGQGRSFDDLRPAAINVDPEALSRATNGFHRAFPARSAKRVLHVTQIILLAFVGYGLWRATAFNAALTLRALYGLAFGLFTAAIIWRLIAAARLTPVLSRLAAPAQWPIYTILCPLYREANVVGDLIAALERIDYPGLMHQSGVVYDTGMHKSLSVGETLWKGLSALWRCSL